MAGVDVTTLERPISPRPTFNILPQPRGPITESLFKALTRSPGALSVKVADRIIARDALFGDDAPLALFCLYELHNRGFRGVSDDWEWDPDCLELRRRLECAFVRQLRYEVFLSYGMTKVSAKDVAMELTALARTSNSQLLSFIATDATSTHVEELAIHRSMFRGNEIESRVRAASQLCDHVTSSTRSGGVDDFGLDATVAVHAEMFRMALEATGIDGPHGTSLESVPSASLSSLNLVTMFALHRRWRAALVGYVALREMCLGSAGSYVTGLERLGMRGVVDYCRAQHDAGELLDSICLDESVSGFVAAQPELSSDVIFGARSFELLEGAFITRLMTAWSDGRSSLRSGRPSTNSILPCDSGSFYDESQILHSVV